MVAHWKAVWSHVRCNIARWRVEYRPGASVSTAAWEIQEPDTLLDFQAKVLYVLFQGIHQNSSESRRKGAQPKWHPYYHENDGRFFLLHRLLADLNARTCGTLTGGKVAMCMIRPVGVKKQRTWLSTPGGQIHSACEKFTKGNIRSLQNQIES